MCCIAFQRKVQMRGIHIYICDFSSGLECKSIGINGITQEGDVKRKEGQEVSPEKCQHVEVQQKKARANET